jgi:TonB family protein
MNSFLGLENIPAFEECRPTPDFQQPPRLLTELEPWGRTFGRNLADFLLRRRPPAVAISSPPAPFWPDVFVTRPLPWFAFAESILYHGIFVVLAWGFSTFLATRPQVVQVRRFDPAEVIYYSPSEYLAPLDTGSSHPAKPHEGDPEFAKQPILSVPPEADNRHQTIVTPPDIELTRDVATPNIVAWGDHTVPVPGAAIERQPAQLPALPGQIVAPVPDVQQAGNRNLASLSQSVVAPPPQEITHGVRAVASLSIDVVAPAPDAIAASERRTLRGPQAAVVEPPPAVKAASIRKLGDINIGRSDVIAPAPQLGVEAQRTLSTLGSAGKAVVPPPPTMDAGAAATGGVARNARAQGGLGVSGAQVVPPPPSIQGSHSADAGGRLIALGIHPSVTPPAEPPHGNRRGTFAATPEGKPGAAGTPEIRADNAGGTDGHGIGKDAARTGAGSDASASAVAGAPPGLHVGAAARPASNAAGEGSPSNPATGRAIGNAENSGKSEIASNSRPRSSSGSIPQPKAELVENPNPLERQIFHDRRLYSMTLNMPNLNSAGGSWVIRFAELESNREQGELIAPVADHKVDPAYPIQLMRENVAGTVTLRAIIRADGGVGDIQVVNGADARLDQYASQALARWHFRPAMKNDANVDVEAIVMIPFKPVLRKSAF